jgi:uncharacterized small protein (DUF1192 family)
MCKCTPEIRTPFCGKNGCEWPKKGPRPTVAQRYHELTAEGEIDRLRGEVNRLRGACGHMMKTDRLRLPPVDRLKAQVERLEAEVTRLRQALSDYGEHDAGCPRWSHSGEAKPGSCECGLDRELGIET